MKCPICKRPVAEPAPGGPVGSFPFCTDRCKLIDLGRWLDGKYQIPIDEDEDAVPARRPPAGSAGDGLDD